MKEFKAIVDAYNKIDLRQRKAALATVVKVRGSSYRSPGARMLITDDGKWVGSISGGCLEGDALRKARQVMSDKMPRTITYDTREESNQNLGIGLGCNGVIDVLIEPIDTLDTNNAIDLYKQFINTNDAIALGTVFSGAPFVGEKLLISSSLMRMTSFSDPQLGEVVTKDLQQLFTSHHSQAKKYLINNQEVEVFVELIQPCIKLMIFGGGFDARPVTQLGKSLGWNVTVTDECVAHIAPVFFPAADNLSLCHRDFVERDFDITEYTACVLMSHNYEYDRDVLKTLLGSASPYIGILGPRKRFDKMVDEFALAGIELKTNDVHRIHSPIGLDIGAETPDEIALSIIAEIQSKFANRSGGFLKYRNAPIHQRDNVTNQVFKQVFLNSPDDIGKSASN
jgi:xanthine/CO dehydrogenase XdhC/CoxF family maturation factor